MKKYIFFMLISSSLYAMKHNDQNNDHDYSFLIGEAGSDYYSKRAESAFIRRQRIELEYMLLCKCEKENKPKRRTQTYSK